MKRNLRCRPRSEALKWTRTIKCKGIPSLVPNHVSSASFCSNRRWWSTSSNRVTIIRRTSSWWTICDLQRLHRTNSLQAWPALSIAPIPLSSSSRPLRWTGRTITTRAQIRNLSNSQCPSTTAKLPCLEARINGRILNRCKITWEALQAPVGSWLVQSSSLRMKTISLSWWKLAPSSTTISNLTPTNISLPTSLSTNPPLGCKSPSSRSQLQRIPSSLTCSNPLLSSLVALAGQLHLPPTINHNKPVV